MKRVYTVKGINGLSTKNLALFELKGDGSTAYSPFRVENQDGEWVVVCSSFTKPLRDCSIFVLKFNGWQKVRINETFKSKRN